MINTVMNQGLQGMQTSLGKMQKSADRIADQNILSSEAYLEASADLGAGTASGELTAGAVVEAPLKAPSEGFEEALVNMKIEQRIYEASAKVVQTGSDTLGTLINMKA